MFSFSLPPWFEERELDAIANMPLDDTASQEGFGSDVGKFLMEIWRGIRELSKKLLSFFSRIRLNTKDLDKMAESVTDNELQAFAMSPEGKEFIENNKFYMNSFSREFYLEYPKFLESLSKAEDINLKYLKEGLKVLEESSAEALDLEPSGKIFKELIDKWQKELLSSAFSSWQNKQGILKLGKYVVSISEFTGVSFSIVVQEDPSDIHRSDIYRKSGWFSDLKRFCTMCKGTETLVTKVISASSETENVIHKANSRIEAIGKDPKYSVLCHRAEGLFQVILTSEQHMIKVAAKTRAIVLKAARHDTETFKTLLNAVTRKRLIGKGAL